MTLLASRAWRWTRCPTCRSACSSTWNGWKPPCWPLSPKMAAINLVAIAGRSASAWPPGRSHPHARRAHHSAFWARDPHDAPPRFLFLRRSWEAGRGGHRARHGSVARRARGSPTARRSPRFADASIARAVARGGAGRSLPRTKRRSLARPGRLRSTSRDAGCRGLRTPARRGVGYSERTTRVPNDRGLCAIAAQAPRLALRRVHEHARVARRSRQPRRPRARPGRRYLLQGIKLPVCDVSSVARQPVSNAVAGRRAAADCVEVAQTAAGARRWSDALEVRTASVPRDGLLSASIDGVDRAQELSSVSRHARPPASSRLETLSPAAVAAREPSQA